MTARAYAVTTIAGIAVCLVLGWLGLLALDRLFTRPYSADQVRAQWASDGTFDRLRAWAAPYIGQEDGGSLLLRTMPSVTEPKHINTADLLVDDDGIVVGVAFELGGAENHHGIVIGSEQVAELSWFPVQDRWAEDLWWYDEVPGLDPDHEK